MASITISRGTPFSAASWVMAVTNSLFMLACPPLFHSISAPSRGPHNKRSGGHPLLSVASVDGSVWPCRAEVYHRPQYQTEPISISRAKPQLATTEKLVSWAVRVTAETTSLVGRPIYPGGG